jgi:transposase
VVKCVKKVVVKCVKKVVVKYVNLSPERILQYYRKQNQIEFLYFC